MAIPFSAYPRHLSFSKHKIMRKSVELTFSENYEDSPDKMIIHQQLPAYFSFEFEKDSQNRPKRIWVTCNPFCEQAKNDSIPKTLHDTFSIMYKTSTIRVSTKIEKEIRKVANLECKICVREFSQDKECLKPLILSGCGHSFCKECIQKLIKNSTNEFISCPFDRRETEKNLENLKTNRSILEFIQERNPGEEEEPVDVETVEIGLPCFEDPDHIADCYCTICKVELCISCFNHTHSSKTMGNHKFVTIAEKPIILPVCEIHPHIDVKFLCKNPNCPVPIKLFCEACRQHTDCRPVNLSDVTQAIQILLQKLVEKLKNDEENCLSTVETLNNLEISQNTEEVIYSRRMTPYEKMSKFKEKSMRKKFEKAENDRLEKERDEAISKRNRSVEIRKKIEMYLLLKKDFLNIDSLGVEAVRSLHEMECLSSKSSTSDETNSGNLGPFRHGKFSKIFRPLSR